MSQAKTRHSASPHARTAGLPGFATWTSPALIAVGLFLGLLTAVLSGTFSWVYTACFVIASLAAVTLVNLRGLYLTVASIPVLWAAFTFIAGWGISFLNAPEGASPINTTTLLTSAFPLLQFFPSLLITTLGAALIAVVRYWLTTRKTKSVQEREVAARRASAAADRRNRDTAVRARRRSSSLTVAELKKRAERDQRARAERDERTRAVRAERAARPSHTERPARPQRAARPITNTEKPAIDPSQRAGTPRRTLDDDLYDLS